ncbi:class II histone deacetylase [Roseisalinus antarcticus]|uniref:Histone deacetylase-like amidohydrolase n=1 Tax=Roseisalinus antarcticus TaxID=254357 RepID=A0A1Y5TWX5_9RHOB|nr:class II histone deacetylase [Roseisalinus antarcticus]SLN72444.1 Histone deacetylase-like amidohydrolase [Roseisalinus antarcticus]
MTTGFFWAEHCFWQSGGNYAGNTPVGGFVQPLAAGGLPENPEGKRRLKNLLDVSGLSDDLQMSTAVALPRQDLELVHDTAYLDRFEQMSREGGGEIGLRAPFGPDGYPIAALSAGLAAAAVDAVLVGQMRNSYALSRPPGHHCSAELPSGFCLLNNIAIAVVRARSEGRVGRVAILDWDVHHGNGTEAIFYAEPEVLTVSMHQERNFPLATGSSADRGEGAGEGANLNIPLPSGAGHTTWLEALDRIALPAIRRFEPDLIVVACGYDAGLIDPLGRMLCTAQTFREMARRTVALADDICGGRFVAVHEGGYSEVYVPFCGHAVLEEMSGSAIGAPDPFAATFHARQPGPRFEAFASGLIAEMAEAAGLP